jgi:hypothetical protein
MFEGNPGSRYFYSRAHDGAENIEPAPAAPDANTVVDRPPPAVKDITKTSEDPCLQGEGPVARTLARCACGLRPLLHVAVLPRAAVAF